MGARNGELVTNVGYPLHIATLTHSPGNGGNATPFVR